MLVDVVMENIVKLFNYTEEWNVVVIFFVDNGIMILLPIRSWIFPGLWRYYLYCSLLRN